MVKIYFDNCPGCARGILELSDDTKVTAMIDAARAQWGNGRLVRHPSGGEWNWIHEHDARWVGCCADKVYLTGQK